MVHAAPKSDSLPISATQASFRLQGSFPTNYRGSTWHNLAYLVLFRPVHREAKLSETNPWHHSVPSSRLMDISFTQQPGNGANNGLQKAWEGLHCHAFTSLNHLLTFEL